MDPRDASTSARRSLVIGASCSLVAIAILLLPLALGRWELNKYIVVVGFILLLFSMSVILHGTWDLLRSRR